MCLRTSAKVSYAKARLTGNAAVGNACTVASMRRKCRRLRTAAALGAALLSLVSCQRYQLLLPGDVKDLDGKPIPGCTVELLVRRQLLGNWTGYVAREAVTDPEGAFSFDVLAPPGSSSRLRVAHPGYQEWLLEAPSSGTPTHVHITLLRVKQSRPGVASTGG